MLACNTVVIGTNITTASADLFIHFHDHFPYAYPWCFWSDLNRRPRVLEAHALTAELQKHMFLYKDI